MRAYPAVRIVHRTMHIPAGAQQPTTARSLRTSAGIEPTREQFDAYRGMFGYFNEALFAGTLPEVVLNFSRHARTNGFFAPERWQHASSAARSHEISLNPDTLMERDPRSVASTLVHEMVHLWQHVHGKPSRKSYHDRQWASKMEAVGLIPSNTGAPGGKRVGSKMTHYIEEGGPFARAYEAMPEAMALPWRSSPVAASRPRRGGNGGAGEPDPTGGEPSAKRRDPSKLKYTCPGCCANVWGKPGLNLHCGDCNGEPFVCEVRDDEIPLEQPSSSGGDEKLQIDLHLDPPHEAHDAPPTLDALEMLFEESDYFPLRIGDRLDLTDDGAVLASVAIDGGTVVVRKVGSFATAHQLAAAQLLAARIAGLGRGWIVEQDQGEGAARKAVTSPRPRR